MPRYVYRALTEAGWQSRGTLHAPSRGQAIRRLAAGGHNVLDLREESGAALESTGGLRFWRRRIRLSTFTRQLATLSASGVPLVQSFNVLIEQTHDPAVIRILADIRESVEGGSTLADALAEHPRVFPHIMHSMVGVGERGGTLDEVLGQLADLYEREELLRGEVHAALAYPALVLFLGLASAVLLIAFLIPRLKVLFEGVGQTLPLPTRILLGISDFVTGHGWLLTVLVVAAFVAYRVARRSQRVHLLADRVKLTVPMVGRLIRTVAIARFARLLGTLTRGGISVVDGIEIVRPAVGNAVIAEAVRSMSGRIRGGESVAAVMKKTGVFPPLPIQMIAVGEETGHLDQMLLRMADAYEREAATATRVMTSLLAPGLILVVAVVVGFIILSMLLPIFQLSSVMR